MKTPETKEYIVEVTETKTIRKIVVAHDAVDAKRKALDLCLEELKNIQPDTDVKIIKKY